MIKKLQHLLDNNTSSKLQVKVVFCTQVCTIMDQKKYLHLLQ